jgi:hypothetical protein
LDDEVAGCIETSRINDCKVLISSSLGAQVSFFLVLLVMLILHVMLHLVALVQEAHLVKMKYQ